MRKLIFQMMISLDGYYEGPNREIDWHVVDEEFNQYAIQMLNSLDTMIFGRITYELMAGYWPAATEHIKGDLLVAERMNNLRKIVFSKTLKKVEWNNSMLKHEVIPEEVLKLKQQAGKDIWVGGSDLALTFIQHNLIDEFRILVAPVVLGKGKSLFGGLKERLNLKLTETRPFKSGNVLLYYEPDKIRKQ